MVHQYREKFDPSTHNKLKKDQLTEYKKEQIKQEIGKQKLDEIVESLLSTGIISINDLEKH